MGGGVDNHPGNRQPRAILWDMDGTLVDTEPLWGVATYEMARTMGRELTDELRASTVGGTTLNTVRTCARHAGVTLDADDEQRWIHWMFDRVAELFAEGIDFRPGARELLDELHRRGTPMALVTNTARCLTDVSLRTIGEHYFTVTVCADEVAQGKPAPDIYLSAAAQLGCEPQDCLTLEDSAAGMASAHAAGCRVVGVPVEPGVEVPDGVRTLDALLPGHRDLSGLAAADLDGVFQTLSA